MVAISRPGFRVRATHRWREPDSNHRSRCCKRLCWALPIGTSARSVEPPKVRSEIARIDLGALPWPFRSRRDRWFESGSLQRGVGRTSGLGQASDDVRVARVVHQPDTGRAFQSSRFVFATYHNAARPVLPEIMRPEIAALGAVVGRGSPCHPVRPEHSARAVPARRRDRQRDRRYPRLVEIDVATLCRAGTPL
jgi:hypothetical protein